MTPIFLSQYDSEANKHLVIEGGKTAVWAFILDSPESGILFDGFLCSRGYLAESEAEIEQFLQKGESPPLLRAFASEEAVQQHLTEDDLSTIWEADAVTICIRGKAFLEMDFAEQKSYSRALALAGPYGEPFGESLETE